MNQSINQRNDFKIPLFITKVGEELRYALEAQIFPTRYQINLGAGVQGTGNFIELKKKLFDQKNRSQLLKNVTYSKM